MRRLTAASFGNRIEPLLPAIYRAAYRLTGNVADAEDLVQDACLKVFADPSGFLNARSPCNWLIRVQYHLFIDQTRRADQKQVRRLQTDDVALLRADDGHGNGGGRQAADGESAMNCQSFNEYLNRRPAAAESDSRFAALHHIENCSSCAASWRAAEALEGQRIPEVSGALLGRIVHSW